MRQRTYVEFDWSRLEFRTSMSLVTNLRPLLHPMLVHFPIALIVASVALDWVGYWLRLTRESAASHAAAAADLPDFSR